MARALMEQMARTTGVFQALVAIPAVLNFGTLIYVEIFSYPYYRMYDFIKGIFLCLIAAGVLFIVFVQRNPNNTRVTNYYFEIAKSTLATIFWIWLLMDAIFVSERYYWREDKRGPKIARAAISVIVLIILFYPTLFLAIRNKNAPEEAEAAETQDRAERAEAGERQPLLQNEH